MTQHTDALELRLTETDRFNRELLKHWAERLDNTLWGEGGYMCTVIGAVLYAGVASLALWFGSGPILERLKMPIIMAAGGSIVTVPMWLYGRCTTHTDRKRIREQYRRQLEESSELKKALNRLSGLDYEAWFTIYYALYPERWRPEP